MLFTESPPICSFKYTYFKLEEEENEKKEEENEERMHLKSASWQVEQMLYPSYLWRLLAVRSFLDTWPNIDLARTENSGHFANSLLKSEYCVAQFREHLTVH